VRLERWPGARGSPTGSIWREGSAEALPLPDGFTDIALCCTVAEEDNAERMFGELVRITKPGGRVGVIVRAIDRGCWINLPLDTALKTKVETPGMIGGGMSPGGCADASLYQRFHALGLKELHCFPQLVAVRPGSPRPRALSAADPGGIEPG
jgi:hypothetical protein